jgi:UDP-glucose 4-epimerase
VKACNRDSGQIAHPDSIVDGFNQSKVLITGGLGFIGSHLARRLVQLGAKVTLVDSLIPEYGGNWFNIHDFKEKVDVNITDVRDGHAMRYLIQNKDFLFNLAGQTSHLDSMQNPETDLEINCRAQLSILEACRRHNPGIRIVFASTRQIYGRPKSLPVDEEHPINPVDVNGINKAAGEWYHLLYQQIHKIPASALRLTNTYGPGMRVKDARQTFLGVWLRLVVEQKPFEVWNGSQLRDFTYVDDVVDAFLAVASSPNAEGHVFNLGGNEVVNLSTLAKRLVSLNGSGEYSNREFPADRKAIDIGDYHSNCDKINKLLGWRPQIGLDEGLSRSLEFLRANLSHYL